jgi:hypothetical protein
MMGNLGLVSCARQAGKSPSSARPGQWQEKIAKRGVLLQELVLKVVFLMFLRAEHAFSFIG